MRARTDRPLRARCTVLLWFVLAAAGCAGEETVAAPHFETRLVLKDTAGRESSAFQRSDRITLAVIIRNRSNVPRTLTVPSSQTYDCIVYAGDNKEVWRWSAGRMFAQVITELTFAPGESRTFTATWDLTDRTGSPLSPGDYSVVGLVPGRAPGLTSSPVTLTIRRPGAKKPPRTN